MSQPLGSICCNYSVSIPDWAGKDGEYIVKSKDLFLCNSCGSVSYYVRH